MHAYLRTDLPKRSIPYTTNQMVHHHGSKDKFIKDPIQSQDHCRAGKTKTLAKLLRKNFGIYKIIWHLLKLLDKSTVTCLAQSHLMRDSWSKQERNPKSLHSSWHWGKRSLIQKATHLYKDISCWRRKQGKYKWG